MGATPPRDPTNNRVTPALIVSVSGVLAFAALLYFVLVFAPGQTSRTMSVWQATLQGTADERAQNLDRALAELMADARTFADYPSVRDIALHDAPHAVIPHGQHVHVEELLRDGVRVHGQTNAWVVNRAGKVVAQATAGDAPSVPVVASTAQRAMQSRHVQLQQVLGEQPRTYIAEVVHGPDTASVVGALVLAVQSEYTLFPIAVGPWGKTTSGEVFLLERSDSALVALTPLRKARGSGVGVRLKSLGGKAMSALFSQDRLAEFSDYSGDPVLAAARPLRNAPWLVVAKVNRQEAFRATHRAIWETAAAVFGLLAAMAGLAYGFANRLRTERALALAREQQQEAETRRRFAEATEQYNALSARSQALLEANVVGIAICTAEGAIVEANEYYLNLIGCARDELMRGELRWTEITPAEHLAHDLVAIRELRERGTSTPYEKQYIRKDGERVWVLVGDVLMPGPAQEILTFVVNISAQKQLEAQYQHAQKMEAIGRLAGGVAHDFNNVLTAIKGIAALALEELPPASPLYSDLQEIDEYADRATGLTRQLLAFSRRQILQPRVFDVADLLRQLQRMLSRLIGEDIHLAVEIADAPLAVHADPAQIEQVLMNLVVNARDAMPNGGRITVSAKAVQYAELPRSKRDGMRGDKFVLLSVVDTGVGMSRETMARIFEPFFTTKEQTKGTGLGLATVYGIVKQSNGVIDVISSPNAGTIFHVYLPYSAVAAARPEASHRHAHAAGDGRAVILLVEDDPAVRALVRRALQRKGHRVLEAGNASEALRLADTESRSIDLVLTDLVMPGLSGRELAAQLRQKHGPIKTLFMSGYSADVVEQIETLDGAFIEKPFTPKQLLAVLSEVLGSDEPRAVRA